MKLYLLIFTVLSLVGTVTSYEDKEVWASLVAFALALAAFVCALFVWRGL